MLDFTLTGGPYGDETSDYSVRVLNGMTVMEFCRQVDKNEWGSIDVNGKRLAEYTSGRVDVVDNDLFGRVSQKRVVSVSANGGWGMMDYYLLIEE